MLSAKISIEILRSWVVNPYRLLWVVSRHYRVKVCTLHRADVLTVGDGDSRLTREKRDMCVL